MVETAAAPAATVPTAPPLRRAGARTQRCRPRIRQRNTVGDNRFARYQLHRPRGRRCADPRPERVGQVDAGVDHGGPDGADRRQLPARRQAGIRSGRCGGDLVPGGPAAADAQPRRPGSGLGGRVFDQRPRPRGGRVGDRGTGSGAGEATHRSAQRRPDAPRRARGAAGPLTARAHPRRAAGRPGRGEPARACCGCWKTCVAARA